MEGVKDKVVFITGAAGGLGRAYALHLAGRGAKIAIIDISEEQGRVTAAEANAQFFPCDVSDQAAVLKTVDAVTASLGAITLNEFLYLLAITFSTGMLALLIYYFGLKRILASRAAVLELAWPLSAVIVGYLFLHQGLTGTQAFGALVLTGSIYLLTRDVTVATPAESALKSEPKLKQKPKKAVARGV